MNLASNLLQEIVDFVVLTGDTDYYLLDEDLQHELNQLASKPKKVNQQSPNRNKKSSNSSCSSSTTTEILVTVTQNDVDEILKDLRWDDLRRELRPIKKKSKNLGSSIFQFIWAKAVRPELESFDSPDVGGSRFHAY